MKSRNYLLIITMTLLFMLIFLYGCGNKNSQKEEPKGYNTKAPTEINYYKIEKFDNFIVYKFTEDGHDFITFYTGHGSSMLHNPACACFKKMQPSF